MRDITESGKKYKVQQLFEASDEREKEGEDGSNLTESKDTALLINSCPSTDKVTHTKVGNDSWTVPMSTPYFGIHTIILHYILANTISWRSVASEILD